MAENIRELALDVLLALEKKDIEIENGIKKEHGTQSGYEIKSEFSSRLITDVLDKYDYLERRDKAFLKRVTEGTIERQMELDYYLNVFSSVPVNKMKPLIRCLLRLGVYQVLYMDNVPDSAVCNEACKLAAKRGFKNLKGFVNGVLRSISRNKDRLSLPDEDREPVRYLSVKYSMPEWLVELWLDEYGRKVTETLLEGLLKIHPVSLRFRTDLSDAGRKECVKRIEEQGVKLMPNGYLPYCFLLGNMANGNVANGHVVNGHTDNIRRLPGYEEGSFTVQDVSSALAVEAAGLKEGDFVIDVCAAPGGKSILAAEKAGRVLARDVSEEKTALIRENAERMRADNIEIQMFDGTQTDGELMGRADVVLLDVPCSGLGVIGKKRDIKYRVTREGLKSLSCLQKQIVAASAGYVKPGGTLVYSTCTIHRAENEDMVRFITRELGFMPESLEGILPEAVLAAKKRIAELKSKEALGHDGRKADAEKGFADVGVGTLPAAAAAENGLTAAEDAACIQLLPGFMESDGFFIARFRRPLSC